MKHKWKGPLKRREQTEVMHDLGMNFAERQVLLRGHVWQPNTSADHGIDAWMWPYDASSREPQPGLLRFQIKSRRPVEFVADNKFVSIRIENAHLRYWVNLELPTILVVYDAAVDNGYWLNAKDYVLNEEGPINYNGEKSTLRIPAANTFSPNAVDRLHNMLIELVTKHR